MEISNEYLKASFQAKGAEQISLVRQDTGIEYLWQADPAHWGRHAPVLFPVVGRLKEDSFTYGNTTYAMDQHGFARDETFSVVSLEQDQIHFSLMGSLAAREKFPFRFNLLISYQLVQSSIEVTYEVRNTDSERMYFSIGGHPAFNCPVDGRGKRADYWFEFEKEESSETHRLENGLFTGETERILNGRRIQISENLFEKDALVFKDLKSSLVSLHSPEKKWLTFHFDSFPYLGIWSKSSDAPFVCIEPWFGLADHQAHDRNIRKKEGIQVLEPESNFRCSYRIEIH